MSYDAPQPSPQQPYGQPPGPYGQQPGPAGQQPNPYGGGPYENPTPHGAPYTHWIKRVGSYVVDVLVVVPFYVLAIVFFMLSREVTESQSFRTTDGQLTTVATDVSFGGPFLVLAIVLFLAAIAFALWNVIIRQGRTGRSLGKSTLGTVLLKEETGRPLGAGMTFVRQVCHVLDGFFYLGYLWPLWDAKRQTFADKIVGTVVLDQPTG